MLVHAKQFTAKKSRQNRHIVPGWSRNVKTLHKNARDIFLKWVTAGRERDSDLFVEMQVSCKLFKTGLKACQKDRVRERGNYQWWKVLEIKKCLSFGKML